MRRKGHKWVKNLNSAAAAVRRCVRRVCVWKAGRKEGREGTYVARSELRAIWRKREGTHEATVGVQ